MTTPSEELSTAAQRLRKLADDATPGPWQRPLNTRYKSTVTGPLPEGERGSWLDGIDPSTGEREHCTVVMVNTWSTGRHTRDRSGRDLEYVAAMHPGVGAVLAELLETAADYVADDSPTHPTHLVRALAVARAINGGEQP